MRPKRPEGHACPHDCGLNGAAPARQGQPTVLAHGDIPDRLIDHRPDSEVMVLLHKPVPEGALDNMQRTNFSAPDHVSYFWLRRARSKMHATPSVAYRPPC